MKQSVYGIITAVLLCTQYGAQAQSDTAGGACIHINGEVLQPLILCAADIRSMPHTTISVPDKKGAPRRYTGVPLAELLNKAGAFSGNHKTDITRYLLISCADGYKVVLALSEFDRNFGNKTAILADSADGKPLPKQMGPYRIILPGEKKMARSCYNVTSFTIGSVKN